MTVTQSAEPTRFRPVGRYVPPEGSVFVAAGGRTGVLRVDGVYAAIEAEDEDAILAAARALEPLPSSG